MPNQTEIVELSKLACPKRPSFGEFLVTHRVIDRFQLFRALQLQDRMPKARLGQCAVALGYAPRRAIEHLHVRFTRALDEALEAAETEAFVRAHEPETQPDGCLGSLPGSARDSGPEILIEAALPRAVEAGDEPEIPIVIDIAS